MDKNLVIVESPAKAKTIKKYLGRDFSVLASVGHVIDLPERELGVDVEKGFAPKYVVIKGKAKVLQQIIAAVAKSDRVYLACDPDREGEAIAWHIADYIMKKGSKGKKGKGPLIYRASFNEITAGAVRKGIDNPGKLDRNLFEAQQARRILDRLVGYKISPILWDKVKRGLSAGRVQSVAVRIVCEREAEIEAFKSEEYWTIVANLEGSLPPPFEAKLVKFRNKEAKIGTSAVADDIVKKLRAEQFLLKAIKKSERKRHPSPPFITSKLQMEAARKLGFGAKKTMMLAQKLYEGVKLGEEGLVGLITYMRTDSVRVADVAIKAAREHISARYGAGFLPEKPVIYKGRRGAQDAHEAIRPTSTDHPPEKVEAFLERDEFRLYELIWKRFVASQMRPAVFDQTQFDIEAGEFLLRATGQVLRFKGFISVYMEDVDETPEKDEEENPQLPDLKEGEILKPLGIEPHQHFTQPPPRFTEASLVKELEEKGIGRPSTYASIMSTIEDKCYVEKLEKRFKPTELGKLVNGLLVENFPKVVDVGFTAQMETELDNVEDGKMLWTQALADFYGPFESALSQARKMMRNVKREPERTDIVCEKCGAPMVVRWGRHGEFLACSAFPKCRNTKEFKRGDAGGISVEAQKETDEKCDKCGGPMVVKRGRFGEFLACSRYPECKGTKSIKSGVACPECGKGQLVQRRSKRGKGFYGCDKYPDCKFALWDKPVPEKCPECGSPVLVEKRRRGSDEVTLACPKEGCGYKKP